MASVVQYLCHQPFCDGRRETLRSSLGEACAEEEDIRSVESIGLLAKSCRVSGQMQRVIT
jgi:hypothetical protein